LRRLTGSRREHGLDGLNGLLDLLVGLPNKVKKMIRGWGVENVSEGSLVVIGGRGSREVANGFASAPESPSGSKLLRKAV
jgi:hypothetical protein